MLYKLVRGMVNLFYHLMIQLSVYCSKIIVQLGNRIYKTSYFFFLVSNAVIRYLIWLY